MGEEAIDTVETMNKDPKRSKIAKGVWVVSSILSFLFCLVWAMSFTWYKDYQAAIPGPLVGNKVSSTGALKEHGFPFSFIVIGDPHSRPEGFLLMKKAINGGPSSFMVILGDLVRYPYVQRHRYFISALMKQVRPLFPVFVVTGNHDVNYNNEKRGMTPEQYDSLYGSRNFDFVYNDCLFILCGLDARDHTGYLRFLKDTLSQKAKGRKHIFIFMHWPPSTPGIPAVHGLPGGKEFYRLLGHYRVTICFFGDYHGYWRGLREGTSLIVSGGGGGDPSNEETEWGKFHHLLRITVNENGFTEEMMISADTRDDIRERLKKRMFISLFPIIEGKGWVLCFLFTCFLAWGISSVIIFFRLLKKR